MDYKQKLIYLFLNTYLPPNIFRLKFHNDFGFIGGKIREVNSEFERDFF